MLAAVLTGGDALPLDDVSACNAVCAVDTLMTPAMSSGCDDVTISVLTSSATPGSTLISIRQTHHVIFLNCSVRAGRGFD